MSSLAKTAKPPRLGGKTLGRRIAENWQLYLLLVIPVVITVIYKYIPMYGIQIALTRSSLMCVVSASLLSIASKSTKRFV